MKRSEAIAEVERMIGQQMSVADIVDFVVDVSSEADGWESEEPHRPVFGPPTLSDYLISQLMTRIERDLFGSPK